MPFMEPSRRVERLSSDYKTEVIPLYEPGWNGLIDTRITRKSKPTLLAQEGGMIFS